MSRQISRDPFARMELHSERAAPVRGGCAWCGRILCDRGRLFLFAYEVQTDDGRSHLVTGRFCSIDCMRTYHA